MQVLETTVTPQSEEFQANAEAMEAHIQTFREVEQKVLDLAEAAREKFTKRGKLLPRDRINRLLDRGTPFLELCSLAGYQMHDDKDGSLAGGGIIAGIGTVSGIRCLVVASNSAIKGGTITPAGLTRPCACTRSPWKINCRWSRCPKVAAPTLTTPPIFSCRGQEALPTRPACLPPAFPR